MIKVSHKNACPVFSLLTYSEFLLARPYVLAPLLLMFGVIVTLVGRRFFAWTIGFIGFLIGFGITMLLFSMLQMFDSIEGPQKTDHVLFDFASILVSLTIGLFLGFIQMRMLKLGASILGAVGSFFIGMTLYQLLLFFTKSYILLMIISISFAILGFILSFRFYDKIVIFGTAFIGAYSLVRGASLIFGHYPNEFEMFKMIAHGHPENMPQ